MYMVFLLIVAWFLLRRLEKRAATRRQKQMELVWSVGTLIEGVSFDLLVFRDELYGLAFGHSRDMAWVYRTSDGGKQWQTRNALGTGRVESACIVSGEAVFALRGLSDDPKRVLCRSDDGGGTWKDMNTPCEGRYLHFIDTENGIQWNDADLDEQPPVLCSTRDGGKTWNRINIPSDMMLLDCAVSSDGSVYYLRGVHYRNPVSDPTEPLFRYKFQVVHLTPERDGWHEECAELPVDVSGAQIYVNGRSVWIGVNDSDKYWHAPNRLGRWSGSGEFEVIDNGFPAIHAVSFNGFTIVMLCGGPFSDFFWKMGGGIPPPTFCIYWSKDAGQSWRSETSPLGMDRPAAVLGNHVWGIGLDNRVYHRQVL